MAIERRMSRDMFNENAIVELRQMCLTPTGMFEAGRYFCWELPDEAFDMGLVEALPSVRGNSEELPPEKADGTTL